MHTLLSIVLLLTFYIICLIPSWLFIHNAYSKGGSLSGCTPDLLDLFMVFTPVFNIVGLVAYILQLCNKRKSFLLKIFNIKK